MAKLIDMNEVAKHNKENDCWIVIHGKVYNMTPFLDEHPGGSQVILEIAGKEATAPFEAIHSQSIIGILPKQCYIGEIDKSTIKPEHISIVETINKSNVLPPIDQMINVFDFENNASKVMKKDGWDYYQSGADDEITLRENQNAFSRIWFRPRVLIDVSKIDTTSKILGYNSSIPLYVTATALGKLAHPDGECAITRACYNENIIQMIPTLASCSLEEITSSAKVPKQILFYQCYVNQDRNKTKEMVLNAYKRGCKGLFITVDAPQLGRRERDMRNKFSSKNSASVQKGKNKVKNKSEGVAKALSSFIDPSLNWNDLKWFKNFLKNTDMKIVLKGIQCGEDAILAYKYNMDGIVVSNHGGRQLDYARSGIEVLTEVMNSLESINYNKNKFQVFIDGGIRRGTDIFKALALGASAVGVGRPTLYGLATYGQEGVERVIQLLKNELEVTMQLMGTPTINDIHRNMVITKNLGDHFAPNPKNMLAKKVYNPLKLASKL